VLCVLAVALVGATTPRLRTASVHEPV